MSALSAVEQEASGCVRCPQLAESRTQVVFGTGNPDADLFFLAEAPGRNEDELGVPLAGRAAELLTELLAGISLTRDDVFVATALKCRPPGNRDPVAQEIANCRDYLLRQLVLIEPRLVCPLGNFATKLLRGDHVGVRQLHGVPEVRVVAGRAQRLLPLFHPAAALYTKPLLAVLREDFARIPALLALETPEQPAPAAPPSPPPDDEPPIAGQMGLF